MKKILLIEDQKEYFDSYKLMLEKSKLFEVTNDAPVFDKGDTQYLTGEEQLKIIQKMIEDKEYDIILCDLCLRWDDDELLIGKMHRSLSAQLYFKCKDDLKRRGKGFIFVTSRKRWTTMEFHKIDGMDREDKFLRCVHSEDTYLECPYIDEKGEAICGSSFDACEANECFIERLRRLANV